MSMINSMNQYSNLTPCDGYSLLLNFINLYSYSYLFDLFYINFNFKPLFFYFLNFIKEVSCNNHYRINTSHYYVNIARLILLDLIPLRFWESKLLIVDAKILYVLHPTKNNITLLI